MDDVQTWLEATKFRISSTDPDNLDNIEATHINVVYGNLSQRYLVSAWINAATTPNLVRQILAMMVAATVYRRQYSEDLQGSNSWADYLEAQAISIMRDLVFNNISLSVQSGVNTTPVTTMDISFYPRDSSLDSSGNIISAAFTMDLRF